MDTATTAAITVADTHSTGSLSNGRLVTGEELVYRIQRVMVPFVGPDFDVIRPASLEEGANSKDPAVRALVAKARDATADVLTKLAKDIDPKVVRAVAGNRSTPSDVLDKIAICKTDVETRSAVAKNSSTPGDTLTRLGEIGGPVVKHEVAGNPSTPAATLRSYLNSQDMGLAGVIAGNTGAADAILIDLVEGPVLVVRALLRNPNTPEAAIAKAATLALRLRCLAGAHPRCPSKVLEQLAEDENYEVRAAVAGNPATSEELLDQLGNPWFDRSEIREAVAGNPSAAPKLLERLSRGSLGLRTAVGKNPSATAVTLGRLAKDNHNDVRSMVARNPSTPHDAIMVLPVGKTVLNSSLAEAVGDVDELIADIVVALSHEWVECDRSMRELLDAAQAAIA